MLEGIPIPNPNHFATMGTNGGAISMLNNNQLSNSDFLTGAFPAQYGNATAARLIWPCGKGTAKILNIYFKWEQEVWRQVLKDHFPKTKLQVLW